MSVFPPSGGGRHAVGKELYLPQAPATPQGAGPALTEYARAMQERWGRMAHQIQEFARQVGTVVARETIQKAGSRIVQGAVTVGASPFAYTNADGTIETVYVVGGTVSQIVFTRLGTSTTFTTTLPQAFILSPNDTLTVTYTVAPTMTKVLF